MFVFLIRLLYNIVHLNMKLLPNLVMTIFDKFDQMLSKCCGEADKDTCLTTEVCTSTYLWKRVQLRWDLCCTINQFRVFYWEEESHLSAAGIVLMENNGKTQHSSRYSDLLSGHETDITHKDICGAMKGKLTNVSCPTLPPSPVSSLV